MIDWLPACGKQTCSLFFKVSALKLHLSMKVVNCVYDEQSFSNLNCIVSLRIVQLYATSKIKPLYPSKLKAVAEFKSASSGELYCKLCIICFSPE